jgi:type II secretory pathway component GspD/PulD (secretin)
MTPRRSSLAAATIRWTAVFLCLVFVCHPGPASGNALHVLRFENAEIGAVIDAVSRLTGVTFVFDPDQVKGRVTLLSPKAVSPAGAVELLKSALALHGYAVVSRAEATWIVPAERIRDEAVTVKVVPLTYARADEVAHTLSWVAPSVRIVPYQPTNSVVISGDPAAVESLVEIIKGRR